MRSTVLFSLPLAVLCAPQSPGSSHLFQRQHDIVPYIVDDSCRENNQYEKVIHAVKASRSMAATAVKQWWEEGKHQEVAATYLGIPDDGKYKDNKAANTAYENLKRISILSEEVPFVSTWIGINCEDIKNECKNKIDGTNRPIVGYALNRGITGNWYDVVLCDPYYLTDTPEAVYKVWKDQPKNQLSMNWFENDANKMLHELMHINLVTQDRGHIIDERYNGMRVYGSELVAQWIAEGNPRPEFVVNSADSYAQFVNAIYFKNKFGFLPPPGPEPDLKPDIDCVGEGKQYAHKDWIKKHAHNFCAKVADKYKKGRSNRLTDVKAEDKADHTEFTAIWKSKGQWDEDDMEEKCKDAFQKMFDDCKSEGPWHFGAILTFGVGIYEFSYSPRRIRPDPIPSGPVANCVLKTDDSHYKYEVQGSLFASDDYGEFRFFPAVEECGKVTEWEFDYFKDILDNDDYEWKATFKLPKSSDDPGCIGKAIEKSNGPKGVLCQAV